MTAVFALVVGLATVACLWSIALRGASSANALAVVGMLAGLAAAGRVVLGGIPGVEPMTTVVVCAALVLGWRCGVVVGILAVAMSNMVLGHGPWTPWQMVAIAIVATIAWTAAPTLRRLAATGVTWLVVLAAVNVVAVLAYDATMTVSQYVLLVAAEGGGSLASVAVAGASFAVIHVVASTLITMLFAPPLIEALERAALRLSGVPAT